MLNQNFMILMILLRFSVTRFRETKNSTLVDVSDDFLDSNLFKGYPHFLLHLLTLYNWLGICVDNAQIVKPVVSLAIYAKSQNNLQGFNKNQSCYKILVFKSSKNNYKSKRNLKIFFVFIFLCLGQVVSLWVMFSMVIEYIFD